MPTTETPQRIHSARCRLERNGLICVLEIRAPRPLKTVSRTDLGTLIVTTAITRAIDSTAPVFWTRTRAPEAIPRRCGATVPIIAAVLGELNMPEPMPTMSMKTAGHQ